MEAVNAVLKPVTAGESLESRSLSQRGRHMAQPAGALLFRLHSPLKPPDELDQSGCAGGCKGRAIQVGTRHLLIDGDSNEQSFGGSASPPIERL